MPVPDPLPVTFHFDGARLRAFREAKGERREQVAARVPCSVTQIASLELGYVTPGVEKAATIVGAYGCDLMDVLVPIDVHEVPA
jgi:transcriptional regulator with XRE-family HTH domain